MEKKKQECTTRYQITKANSIQIKLFSLPCLSPVLIRQLLGLGVASM